MTDDDHLFVANPSRFLNFTECELEWKDVTGKVMVDVGCGDPKVKLAELLVQRYPRLRRVYAFDNQRLLIRYLNLKNTHPLIVYKEVDIEKRSDVAKFEDCVDHVLSIHCFHMLKDQAAAFENVFFMLRPGGTAGFQFSRWSGHAEWFLEVSENLKWNKYYNGKRPIIPVTQAIHLPDGYYPKILEDIGFKVVYCRINHVWEPYASDQECKESLAKMSDYSFSIPDELKAEFESYLFGIFLKHNVRDQKRKPCHVSIYATIMVKKPKCDAETLSCDAETLSCDAETLSCDSESPSGK